jgi:hypothetical protein
MDNPFSVLYRATPAASISALADIMSTAFTVKNRATQCIVQCAFSVAGILYYRDNSQNIQVNEGTPPVLQSLYEWGFMANDSDPFNFQFSVAATVYKFIIYEARRT